MLINSKNKYFEIIREDVFDENGHLVYNNYVEEFEPYAVSKEHTKFASYGAIQILEFGVKSENEARNAKKDKKFQKKYEQTKNFVSKELLGVSVLLESHVSDALSHSLLSPFLRNLTYGETTLCVWIAEGETYALVNAGRGESACNLLFFCRVENG